MHEADALFLAGHPLLTCRTSTRQFLWLVVCTHKHTLPSLLVHEGDASFLVGHLLSASVLSPGGQCGW